MEFLDIVDKNDKIIDKKSKDEVYKKQLCHRIVHILIFNSQGKMAIQLRSDKVSYCPCHWSTAVGGHVQAGETYKAGALREYLEELGTESSLEFFSKDYYIAPDTPNKFLATYKTTFEGPFNIDKSVVERVDYFYLAEIKKMIEGGEKFHPELLFLLKKYF
jgi:isopentenyldiphosphate isomerase